MVRVPWWVPALSLAAVLAVALLIATDGPTPRALQAQLDSLDRALDVAQSHHNRLQSSYAEALDVCLAVSPRRLARRRAQ